MESRNQLGIYLRKDGATVVCVGLQGRDRKLLDCFSVSLEGQGEPDRPMQMLAEGIARTCSERGVKFAESAVAVDCTLFMQHAVHSEFSDGKKIAATVRFDTEEALATDVADVAVAFRVASSGDDGSNLDVYTAERSVLSDIILSLQHKGIDPVTVEPDVCGLSRYLREGAVASEPAGKSVLYALLSDLRGYLVGVSEPVDILAMRAFLVGPSQKREQLLTREILVTTGLVEAVKPIEQVFVFDVKNELGGASLAERTGLPVQACSLPEMAGVEAETIADGPNSVDFALAYGAALSLSDKGGSANFRNDHLPYQGKKRRMNTALKFLSISLTILFLAIGVYFQSHLLRTEKYRTDLRKDFEPDYLTVMLGKKELPTTMKTAVGDLEKALRQLRRETTGIGDQESISARLTLALQALNECAGPTDLNIDAITITIRDIVVTGDTSRRGVKDVFETMKKVGLEPGANRVTPDGNREKFTVTLEPKRELARK